MAREWCRRHPQCLTEMISGISSGLAKAIGIHQRAAAALLVLSLLILILVILGDPVRDALRYERTGLAAHEMWRVLTAHLVHLGWTHTIMNLAALWLIAWLFGGLFSPPNWLWLGLAAALGISAGLWWFSPEIGWYVGISGILHGFTMAAAIILMSHRIAAGYLVLLMVGGKIVWEQASGALPMTALTSGGAVVVDSHLYGALVGALVSIAMILSSRRSGADADSHPY